MNFRYIVMIISGVLFYSVATFAGQISGTSYTRFYVIPDTTDKIKTLIANDVFENKAVVTWKYNSYPLWDVGDAWIKTMLYFSPMLYHKLYTQLSGEEQEYVRGTLPPDVYNKLREKDSRYNFDDATRRKIVKVLSKYYLSNEDQKERLHNLPEFSHTESDWTYEVKNSNKSSWITVQDISDFVNEKPMTLVSLTGQEYHDESSFSMTSCMTGVVCVISPHREETSYSLLYIDSELEGKLNNFAANHQELSNEESWKLMHYFKDYEYFYEK